MSVTSPNNVGEGGERKKKGVYLSRIWLIQSGQSTQSLQMAVVCSPWFWCVHRHKMPMKFNICLTVYLTFNYWMIIIECWMKALIRRKLLHGVFKLVIFIYPFLCVHKVKEILIKSGEKLWIEVRGKNYFEHWSSSHSDWLIWEPYIL